VSTAIPVQLIIYYIYGRWLGSRVVSVARLRCRRARVQIAVATLSGNNLRQTVHTHCASVHQAAKLGATLLRRKVMAAYRRVYDPSHLQADCQEPGSAPEPSVIEYGAAGYLYLFYIWHLSV